MKGDTVPWAIVTGAGDGLGRSLAIQIARRGLNVVLIGRTHSKLGDVASEIASKYRVDTHVVTFDFAKATRADYDFLIKKEIGSLDVALLINNVGMSYDAPTPLAESTVDLNTNIIRVNVDSPTLMTEALLPQLLKRGCGGIINMSSLSGIVPFPMFSVYNGTKAYNRLFSLALGAELAGSKDALIDVLTVTPGVVLTHMSKGRKKSFFNVPADSTASQILDKVSFTCETCGNWHHDIAKIFYKYLYTDKLRLQFINELKEASHANFEEPELIPTEKDRLTTSEIRQ
jgi:17beta-estradiol 17-dehydrogenase / very-long-chain 3-oxoacyl-CoA reductase